MKAHFLNIIESKSCLQNDEFGCFISCNWSDNIRCYVDEDIDADGDLSQQNVAGQEHVEAAGSADVLQNVDV